MFIDLSLISEAFRCCSICAVLTVGTSLLQQQVLHHWLPTRLPLILSASQAPAVVCGHFDALYLTLRACCALKKTEIKTHLFDFSPSLTRFYLCDLVPNIVFGFLLILGRGVAEGMD